MDSRIEQAHARHKAGYNCAQAVACTYADLFGMDEQTAFRATEGFGLGMGGMEGTCGALTGACFLAGLANSDGDLGQPGTKGSTYKISREILDRFHEMNGSTTCRELKGIGSEHGPLRACPGCVEDACRIVEETLLADK